MQRYSPNAELQRKTSPNVIYIDLFYPLTPLAEEHLLFL
jgi:hypothetical protein